MSKMRITRDLAEALNAELRGYNPDDSTPFIVRISGTVEARWNGGAWSFWTSMY